MENIKTLDKIVVGRRPVTTNNLWVDTTKGNPFIKVYKNGEWVAIDDVTREEVDWIKDEIHRLTDLTPEELDTLKEVADKLIEIEGKFDDYMPLTGGTMSEIDGDGLYTMVYPASVSVIRDIGNKSYSSGITEDGLDIHNLDDSTYIKLYGISHPDGYIKYSDILTKTALQNIDLKIGSENEKHSLEVYGTTRLKGELKLSKSVTGEDINVKGVKSLAAHTITTDSEIKAASVRVDSSLTVGGETNLNGSLNMNGNDINGVQSVDVEGTGRFDTVKTHVLKGNEDGKPLLIHGDLHVNGYDISDVNSLSCDNLTCDNLTVNGHDIGFDDDCFEIDSIKTNEVKTDTIISNNIEIKSTSHNRTTLEISAPDYGDDEPLGGIYCPNAGLSISASAASISLKGGDIEMLIKGRWYSMSSILDKLANID